MGSTYTTSLAIIDPVTGVPHLLALDGYPVTTAVDSTGTRLVQTIVDAAGGCSLYVVDTSAAAQVGTPVVLAGSTYNLATQFTSDGKFAAQTTFEDATGTTRVVVVNTATGAQVGSTFTTTGGGQPILQPGLCLAAPACSSSSPISTPPMRVSVST